MEKTTFQNLDRREQGESPACPEHDRLVLELARGRLDGDRATAAERVRRECPACRSWWQDFLAGEQAAVVDSAVAEAFAGFEAPRRSHPQRWLAAAAVFFALVLGFLFFQHQGGHEALGGEIQVAADEIFTEGFESNGRVFSVALEPTSGEAQGSGDRIFAGSFEAGNFSAWSPES